MCFNSRYQLKTNIMKYLFLIPFLSLLILSCKKEETYSNLPPEDNHKEIVVTGFVYDSLSGNPVSGVPIPYAVCQEYGGLAVASDYSNADGSFKIYILWNQGCSESPKTKPATYWTSLSNSGTYYNHKEVIDLAPYDDGDTVHQNVLAIPYSYLNVRIVSSSATDHLMLACPQMNCLGPVIELGTNVDTIIKRQIASNRNLSINLYANGSLYSSTPYHSQYGTTGTLEIQYP